MFSRVEGAMVPNSLNWGGVGSVSLMLVLRKGLEPESVYFS